LATANAKRHYLCQYNFGVMNRLLRLILIALAVFLAGYVAEERQADCGPALAEHLAFADDQGTIQKPELPPFYLLGKESVSFENMVEQERLLFQYLHATQLTPRNFSYSKTLRLTFFLIDHKAPVPLFIRGHALLC